MFEFLKEVAAGKYVLRQLDIDLALLLSDNFRPG